ncbi:MAG: chaplin family protein [Micromonosporaceae bacterium]
MKTWVRHTVRAGVLAAGFLLFATSPAQAGDQLTADNSGIGTGNNVRIPVAVAVPVCGNGVGVAGGGVGVSDNCDARAFNTEAGAETQATGGNTGIGTGNNVSVPISVAAPVCGNGVGVAGGGVGVSDFCGAKASNEGGAGGGQLSTGNSGILTGNNWSSPISVAVPVCGNGVGVFGGGGGVSDTCKAGASNEHGSEWQYSADNSGIGVGNNFSIPIAVAVPVCGNGVGVFGGGLGVSDTCTAGAHNGDNGDGYGRKPAHRSQKTVKHSKAAKHDEALPQAPTAALPSPAKDLTAPLLGTDQLSTQGNSINSPL